MESKTKKKYPKELKDLKEPILTLKYGTASSELEIEQQELNHILAERTRKLILLRAHYKAANDTDLAMALAIDYVDGFKLEESSQRKFDMWNKIVDDARIYVAVEDELKTNGGTEREAAIEVQKNNSGLVNHYFMPEGKQKDTTLYSRYKRIKKAIYKSTHWIFGSDMTDIQRSTERNARFAQFMLNVMRWSDITGIPKDKVLADRLEQWKLTKQHGRKYEKELERRVKEAHAKNPRSKLPDLALIETTKLAGEWIDLMKDMISKRTDSQS